MLLDEMNQVAYPLIKHQHELVQHFTTVKSRYEQETQDNLTRFLQEKEDNEQKWTKVQEDIARVLEPIIRAETNVFSRDSYEMYPKWKNVVSAEFADHETSENQAYYVQQMKTLIHAAGWGYAQPQAVNLIKTQSGTFHDLLGRIFQPYSSGYYPQPSSPLSEATVEMVKLRLKKFSELPETSMLPRKAHEIDQTLLRCGEVSQQLSGKMSSFLSTHLTLNPNESTLWGSGCTGVSVLVLLLITLGVIFNGINGVVGVLSFFAGLVVFGGLLSLLTNIATQKAKRLMGELKATVTLAEKLNQQKLAEQELQYIRQKEEIEDRFAAAQRQLDQGSDPGVE